MKRFDNVDIIYLKHTVDTMSDRDEINNIWGIIHFECFNYI